MKKTLILVSAVSCLAASSYGQGFIYLNNLANTGIFNSSGGQAFDPANGTGDPVYSSAVTQNGLFFTTDTAAQAGNNGYSSSDSQMLGNDFSFAIYGGATAGSVTTLLGSFTGSAITGDNANWGQLSGPGAAVQIPNGSTGLATVFLEVFAWEGSTYSTFSDALNGGDFVADSGIFSNPSATSSSAPIIPTLSNMPDLLLVAAPIPEPTSLALAGLGGFGMLMALRRKQA